jgi:hypothetical protein
MGALICCSVAGCAFRVIPRLSRSFEGPSQNAPARCKTPFAPAFTRDRAPNTPVVGLSKPYFWSLSARHRLFQQGGKLEVPSLVPITAGMPYSLAPMAACDAAHQNRSGPL